MACFHPIAARLYTNPYTGKRAVSFGQVPTGFSGCPFTPVQLPCGQCIGCRLERSRKWAMRCVMEASMHDRNCFITLTYDDRHLPQTGERWKKDFVDFMKRLRKKVGKVRFFHCGEYGELNKRPHHHAILFGVDFDDRERIGVCNSTMTSFGNSSKLPLVLSPDVSRQLDAFSCSCSSACYSSVLAGLWSLGFSSVGDCTFESAAYVARYIMKKVTGPAADAHYGDWPPEYVTMSRRPGIAEEWIKKYMSDVYPADRCFARGVQCKPPRYFDEKFRLHFPAEFEMIKARRERMAELASEEHVPARLEVKEELVKRRTTLRRM